MSYDPFRALNARHRRATRRYNQENGWTCEGTTLKGTRCTNPYRSVNRLGDGKRYCWQHGG